ncbi:CHAP domain-containing protein [Qipengyuania sp. YG27]|uniref:CHAP domain-containing protein n=2 Tax=Qipengyuania mesophila TaxID=2867246 RepID=A0ABS7JX00_9SPHN|nr:CHAP domain-containing protein [Qipengyuania mesophila]
MRKNLAVFALLACASPVMADDFDTFGANGAELDAYLQCVPYAREVSGIQLYGDAYTWWEQAQGRYATGRTPLVGAVMAFRQTQNMPLGHVATVSRILDSRRVLLDHANWSPIDGRRGQIEKGALAIDVSQANDWSAVRVWYAPLGKVGTTVWPVSGFIYADRRAQPRPQVAMAPARKETSRRFLSAFAEFAR